MEKIFLDLVSHIKCDTQKMEKIFLDLVYHIKHCNNFNYVERVMFKHNGIENYVHPEHGTLLHVILKEDLNPGRIFLVQMYRMLEICSYYAINSTCMYDGERISLVELALIHAKITGISDFVIMLMILGATLSEAQYQKIGCDCIKIKCFMKQYFNTTFKPPLILNENFDEKSEKFWEDVKNGKYNHTISSFRQSHSLETILGGVSEGFVWDCIEKIRAICNNSFDLNLWSPSGRVLENVLSFDEYNMKLLLGSIKMMVKAGAIVDDFTEEKAKGKGIAEEWIKKYRISVLLLSAVERKYDPKCLLTILNKDIIKLILL
jgi:hypothetical protein